MTDQKLALFHEKVHAFLSPKLQFLRDIRVTVAMNGYEKSYLLRYMEEAIAETVAQFRVNGAKGILSGIRFPVDGGYVTVAKMASEARGVLFGPINVGGMIYQVIFLQDHSANSGPGSPQ
ncbi:MAG: hypothetical protein C5B58_08570 [Acidobacteria bacterium]|nr:MAG: hypothetical protein C5B58_08570 [Acidobacteriota bacterium]